MLVAQLITIFLLYYQVTMPSVENAKFQHVPLNGRIYIMNTQTGEIERICDENLQCTQVKK
jgi:hypothetical protein